MFFPLEKISIPSTKKLENEDACTHGQARQTQPQSSWWRDNVCISSRDKSWLDARIDDIPLFIQLYVL
jgi:hypothetical protein